MGSGQSNEEHIKTSAIERFAEDRARLSKVRRSQRGPQDPFGTNYSYIKWLPSKYDVAPPVLYYLNPYLNRVDREYSNKPPFLHAYDRRLFRRQPNLFMHDPDYSTTKYVPPDHRLAEIDPERTPADFDAVFKYRSPYRTSQNPYGELTDPLNIPTPKHENPDPYGVHFLDERGYFRPRKK